MTTLEISCSEQEKGGGQPFISFFANRMANLEPDICRGNQVKVFCPSKWLNEKQNE